jgi:stearoyl-CoA desaturase (delta-9 desaturase)
MAVRSEGRRTLRGPGASAPSTPSKNGLGFLEPLPFVLTHVAALVGAILVGISLRLVVLCLGLYALRMFFVGAGFHRYFAHRSFKTSRAFQFVLAFMGTTAAQKGVLWWAGHHRNHHRFADTPLDPHSPVQRGFLWSHVGWVLTSKYDATPFDRMRDFARYPELRWLNRFWIGPPLVGLVFLYVVGGLPAAVWGGLVSTVLLWHGTFTINSLAHLFGRRRYATPDNSRNSLILALITGGEGWHNNHHRYRSSARQGFFWYEIDMTFLVLRLLEGLGIVWDVKEPPRSVVLERPAELS